jgi:hypothetical protein
MNLYKKPGSGTFLMMLFGTGSLLFFGLFYSQHLYRLEQLQLFEVTFRYLLSHLAVQGGFVIWIGEFFVQFFRIPLAGGFFITALLLLLQHYTFKILRQSGNPNALRIIISFLPSSVYWVLLTLDFYSVSGLAGLLLSVACVNYYLKISSRGNMIISGFVIVLLLYWLAGASYLVFASCAIIHELLLIIDGHRGKRMTGSLPAILFITLLSLGLPLLARKIIFYDTLLQSFTSEAYFQVRIFFPVPLILIFSFYPLMMILQRLLQIKMTEREDSVSKVLLMIILVSCLAAGLLKYADFSREKEIRYENLVYDRKWDKIIRIAEKEQPESPVSLVAVNLALAKTGRLSSEMFRFNQNSKSLFLNYYREGMTPFIASEPFYYMGFINYAQMFAMETVESTIDARYPSRSFRRVAETFILNGQYDIARKYLVPLSHTLFYRRWANDCLSSLGKENEIDSHPEWRELRQSRPASDFYFNEKQMDREMQMLLKSNPRNKVAYEYLMGYYLLNKNFDGFLLNIYLAKLMNYNEMPLTFQEAAVFINSVSPETPPQLLNFPVKNIVTNDFVSFSEIFSKSGNDAKEKTFRDFGKTYWYYIEFK